MKQVILITGTPCTGKTTTSKQLAQKLNATYINLTEYTKTNRLTLGEDKKRQTTIINEKATKQKLTQTINNTQNTNIIIDGHYAAAVTPKHHVTHVFILRRNPIELHKQMKKNGYHNIKLWENLAAEILDVSLTEALQEQNKNKICQIDTTAKTTETIVNEILNIINKNKKCPLSNIDWLGMLEAQGLTDKYLKT
jgi:adenylate kinase